MSRAFDPAALPLPSDFQCPILQDGAPFNDPVVTVDGHTYERGAIELWFRAGRRTSPTTGVRLPSLELTPNHALRSAIAAYVEARPEIEKKKAAAADFEYAVKVFADEVEAKGRDREAAETVGGGGGGPPQERRREGDRGGGDRGNWDRRRGGGGSSKERGNPWDHATWLREFAPLNAEFLAVRQQMKDLWAAVARHNYKSLLPSLRIPSTSRARWNYMKNKIGTIKNNYKNAEPGIVTFARAYTQEAVQ